MMVSLLRFEIVLRLVLLSRRLLFGCISVSVCVVMFFFFFQAEDGIRDLTVTGVQTCALPIWSRPPGVPSARSRRRAARPRLVPRLRADGTPGGRLRGGDEDRLWRVGLSRSGRKSVV